MVEPHQDSVGELGEMAARNVRYWREIPSIQLGGVRCHYTRKQSRRSPEETARVVHAVLPQGNIYMHMRDHLGILYQDQDFADLFPPQGQPAEAPWRLALISIMPYAEGLTDRQAADAVRTRFDWKYALSLELTDPGFDCSLLSEFRSRLLAHGAERRLFDLLLQHFGKRRWIKGRGKQRTDSTHVLAAIRTLNRLECVGETMRHALDVLAEVAPDWLLEQMDPEWAERYRSRFTDFRLPKEVKERVALAETIGMDGRTLLETVYASTSPAWLRELDAIQTLRQVWIQQYHGSRARNSLASRSRTASLGTAHCFSLRCRSSLQQETQHGMDRLHSALYRDV
jgi:transposase